MIHEAKATASMGKLRHSVGSRDVEPAATVYSYYSPEVEQVVQSALGTLNQHRGIHTTLAQNYDPGLDDLHLPLMDRYELFARSEGAIGLDTFANKWFTNGSSEAIFHILASIDTNELLYQLEGEYQGYEAYAEALGHQIITVKDVNELYDHKSGVVILSNPASKDGNIVDPNVITTILRKHQLVVDLAYMGMTRRPLNIDLSQPGIVAVVGSLSKPFGLYYYRIGFCYSKYPIMSLHAHKWFKNALSIGVGEAVLDHFSNPSHMRAFKDTYFALQDDAVEAVNKQFSLTSTDARMEAKRSDVWLLANAQLRDTNPGDLRPFKRAEQNYRFCLTPYYMEWNNG